MELDLLTDKQWYYYALLKIHQSQSKCKDKQVAALGVEADGTIQLVNNIPYKCNELCNHTCEAKHAETMITHCSEVYLTLYPCEKCQRLMYEKGVTEVYVFNNAEPHKQDIGLIDKIVLVPDIIELLRNFNGDIKQKYVAMGELAELITALADTLRIDARPDSRSVPSEMADVLLQLLCLGQCSDMFQEWSKKLVKLISKFSKQRTCTQTTCATCYRGEKTC
jgi:NTP pyrophosphatase (non-canonical NTP hydrolase)